jgi:hypothetical protein
MEGPLLVRLRLKKRNSGSSPQLCKSAANPLGRRGGLGSRTCTNRYKNGRGRLIRCREVVFVEDLVLLVDKELLR